MKTVVGMFSDVGEAQRTFDDLVGFGLGPGDISVVTSQISLEPEAHLELSELDAADAGKIAACGPIATVIARDKSGLMATLQHAGVSPALAEHYVNAVRDGETLESVIVEDRYADIVVEIMKRHAAHYGGVRHRAEGRASSTMRAETAAETAKESSERTMKATTERRTWDKVKDAFHHAWPRKRVP